MSPQKLSLLCESQRFVEKGAHLSMQKSAFGGKKSVQWGTSSSYVRVAGPGQRTDREDVQSEVAGDDINEGQI